MKLGFYPKLAFTGIAKNKKTYLPYILTCIGMVMMFYIILFLTSSQVLYNMRGVDVMQSILSMGCGVIGLFSLIFLFYTNSFLIRRRKKEFGLYNILGMGKRNLARILIWESIIIAVISIIGGLICGILFSKVGELIMTQMLDGDISFSFTVSFQSIWVTLIVFAGIFFLILLNSLRQIHLSNPIQLLRSDNVGEKPPKANWIVAFLGVILLAAAYYLALSIQDPISALMWFFVAVIMVIIATYLLFIAGSVALCKLLQKNKRYYYKTNHFVSVSSMVYRMKRNGAGLASICILSTMVLVIISSTACLYIGAEDSLHSRYPRDILVETTTMEEHYIDDVHSTIDQVLQQNNQEEQDQLHYQYLSVGGFFQEDQVIFGQSKIDTMQLMSSIENVRQIYVVPIDDYNKLMGTNETLGENEALLFATKSDYPYDTISLENFGTVTIKQTVPEFVGNGDDAMMITSSIYLFVPKDTMIGIYNAQYSIYGDEIASACKDYYGFNLDCDDHTQIEIQNQIDRKIAQMQQEDNQFPKVISEGIAAERSGFYALYGGMFFLGVLLGIVFILGAVLIMYYKQVTEGYEDQGRFEILQKVGMTKKEIKKSINSQVLTVFFLPLIAAGVHTAFAFPLIKKMLVLFSLTNTGLLIGITIGSYLLFALFYIIVYLVTSKSYYSIVSNRKKEAA
ncbi:ABC transporter permease [Clostridium facile]|uniref:FtsX-like permease family protein n=1 Tax=Clostridium facile TaxID=2763035 RepID=A0ABR7IPS1_9CLOT|nr:FtsX-like permease family protein [Clostridium facile]MBC5787141.1 FtsX-like permease family protein [Clostridium facile]